MLLKENYLRVPVGSKLLLKVCWGVSIVGWVLYYSCSYSLKITTFALLYNNAWFLLIVSQFYHDLQRLFITVLVMPYLLFNLERKMGTIVFLLDFIIKTILLNILQIIIIFLISIFIDHSYNKYPCYSCWGYLFMHFVMFCECNKKMKL